MEEESVNLRGPDRKAFESMEDEQKPRARKAWTPVMKALKNPTLKLVFFASGIMVSFVMYGVVQERIMTVPYRTGNREEEPDDGLDEDNQEEMFKQSAFLVLMNRLVASMLAFTVIVASYFVSGDKSKGLVRSLRGIAPFYAYCGVSFSNITATWCQYEALKYVNFPTQTLGKTGKVRTEYTLSLTLHFFKSNILCLYVCFYLIWDCR